VSQATFLNSVLQIAATRKLNPYEQDWSFGVERQLGPKAILNLDYIGNKATHLNIRTELNQLTPCNATADCNPDSSTNQSAAGKQSRRPYPNLGLMVYEGWNGYSNYNALNIKLQGGFPFTVTANNHAFVNEAYALRANVVPGVSSAGFHQSIGEWFNTAAFAQPPDGYFGDSSRNALRSPGVANLDLSFFKNIQFERLGIQVRFESFNALNHPEFGFPNLNVNAGPGVYGAITTINTHYPLRQNQAALRLTF